MCVCADAVCAEAYNPDDDDDDDAEPRVVHPKTDEQRRRLQDACKDILLFKTLEQVHTRVKRHAWPLYALRQGSPTEELLQGP